MGIDINVTYAAVGVVISTARRTIIRIVQAKERKDRYVMLSPETLDLLRQWWMLRPARYDTGVPQEERWLFPGRKPGKPMTTRQLNRLCHETADAAGIKKAVTLHALRLRSILALPRHASLRITVG
jgi:integrase